MFFVRRSRILSKRCKSKQKQTKMVQLDPECEGHSERPVVINDASGIDLEEAIVEAGAGG